MPGDRTSAWTGGVPSYQAWCERMATAGLDMEQRRTIADSYHLVREYGENAIDLHSLQLIASHGPLHELGAGGGYVAGLLSSIGADVIASDSEPPALPWFPVKKRAYEEANLDGRTPLLVWPYMHAPTHWLATNPNIRKVIIVNDVAPRNLNSRGGGSYHQELSDNWRVVESTAVNTGWRLYTDYVHVWQRL